MLVRLAEDTEAVIDRLISFRETFKGVNLNAMLATRYFFCAQHLTLELRVSTSPEIPDCTMEGCATISKHGLDIRRR